MVFPTPADDGFVPEKLKSRMSARLVRFYVATAMTMIIVLHHHHPRLSDPKPTSSTHALQPQCNAS